MKLLASIYWLHTVAVTVHCLLGYHYMPDYVSTGYRITRVVYCLTWILLSAFAALQLSYGRGRKLAFSMLLAPLVLLLIGCLVQLLLKGTFVKPPRAQLLGDLFVGTTLMVSLILFLVGNGKRHREKNKGDIVTH